LGCNYNEEYHSFLANDTWDLVPLLKGQKLVRCKWVYRTKFGTDRKVAKMNFTHLVLSLAASFKWEVHQMDVKSPFLHGDFHEDIYMEQPPGLIQTVGIYRVSSSERTPKGHRSQPDLKSIHQYF